MQGTAESIESIEFPVWGGIAVVAVCDRDRLEPARAAVERVIERFDRACSRFRDDSELTALNERAGRAVSVSPLLFDAVAAAVRAASLTDGDVDPTVGEALIALGCEGGFAPVRGRPKVWRVPGWRTVELDAARRTVRLPRAVKLDLGATAKALAVDRAAASAFRAARCGVLASLGGDLATAGPAPAGGWPVRVTDDHRAGVGAPGQWIMFASGGLATSSVTARAWRAGGERLHHLIDPRTGRPVVPVWRTASVAAASCLDANIASTAAVIRGAQAVAWLQSQGLPSRLVSVGGEVRHLAGWPAQGDDLAAGPAARATGAG